MVRIDHYTDIQGFRGYKYYLGKNKPRGHLLISPSFSSALVAIPAARVLFFPFDRIAQKAIVSNGSSNSPLSKSFITLLRQTSPSKIYPILGASCPVTILSLTFNEFFQYLTKVSWKKVKYDNEIETTSEFATKAFISGAASGFIASAICHPFELNRRVLLYDELNRNLYSGLYDSAERRYFTGGIRTLYRGFAVTLVTSPIFRGLLYGGYELSKVTLSPDSSPSQYYEKIISAFSASFVALTLCHPLESLRLAIANESYLTQINKSPQLRLSQVLFKHCSNPLNLLRGIHYVPIKCVPVSMALVFYDQVFSLLTSNWSKTYLKKQNT